MNCSLSSLSDHLDRLMVGAGAVRWGVAAADAVSAEAADRFGRWIAAGRHGDMAYMERYDAVRRDPSLLLDGAQSVIVAAFPYEADVQRTGDVEVSRYALADDYHEALRRRLAPVAEWLRDECGAESRICVDTAPLRERYFAVQAGVGFIGVNNCLIVPGAGSYVFLAEIVTTLTLPPSEPCTLSCAGCLRCVAACPGGALSADGRCADARRCISYLTIEYRGEELPDDIDYGRRLYGCDTCQAVCPHNAGIARTPSAVGAPRPELLALTAESVSRLTPGDFRRLTRHSAMSRVRRDQLLRNLRACLTRNVKFRRRIF